MKPWRKLYVTFLFDYKFEYKLSTSSHIFITIPKHGCKAILEFYQQKIFVASNKFKTRLNLLLKDSSWIANNFLCDLPNCIWNRIESLSKMKNIEEKQTSQASFMLQFVNPMSKSNGDIDAKRKWKLSTSLSWKIFKEESTFRMKVSRMLCYHAAKWHISNHDADAFILCRCCRLYVAWWRRWRMENPLLETRQVKSLCR